MCDFRLKDWVAKAADREKEKAEKRRERMERRKAVPKHMFHDPQYQEQKSKVLDNLDDALRQGKMTSSFFTAHTPKDAGNVMFSHVPFPTRGGGGGSGYHLVLSQVLSGGTPDQDRGTTPKDRGPPPPARIGVPPLSPHHRTIPGRMCGTGGMPLAFTQEDFFV